MALLLLPVWQEALWAQQQSTAPQLGHPQQDYSGQLQSDQAGYPAQPYAADTNAPQANGQPAPQLSTPQLEQLVAPIALYPDRLVALTLTASGYPAQVVDADRWMQAQRNASPEQIVAGADAQSWDASVKALTAFPQVLAQMAGNQPWTGDLGNAYYNQRADTLEAVQVLRSRAQTAGNLQTTAQESVSYVGGNIELAPVNPQIVYVPIYNPWTVYGQQVSPYPGFSLTGALGSFLNSSAVNWGLGIAMNAFAHTPWGWLAWGLSWLAQAVLFNNSNYDSGSAVAGGGYSGSGYSGVGYGYSGGGNGYSGFGGYNQGFGQGMGPHSANGLGYPGNSVTRAQGPVVHRPPTGTPSNVARPPMHSAPPEAASNAGPEHSMGAPRNNVPRPPGSSSGYHMPESAGRGYQAGGYAHGPQPSSSPAVHRPPSSGGVTSAQLQRPSFGPNSSANFGHGSYAGSSSFKQPRSTGFHPFGGGHGVESFHASKASFHAPKESFHAPKMKAPKAPKSFGGHSGGGHSSGGHSGGHSGGGHHH